MIEALKYLIYGLISGLSEIIPASQRGHQSLLMLLFGMSNRDPMLDLMVHAGIIACVIFKCKTELAYLTGKGRAAQGVGSINRYDRRLLYSAIIPMLVAVFFVGSGSKYEKLPLSLALFFFINAIILLMPDYIRQSNKHAGQMGPFDSILIGLSGVFSIFPGLSRLGTGCSMAIIRGADRQRTFEWLLLLTVPAMCLFIITDLIALFSIGLPGITLWLILGYILSAAAAFAGSYIGILLMRFLIVNNGFSIFSFYSFGVSFFAFIIYLVAF